MRTSKLESIFAVILASTSIGARGGCGPCPDQHEAFPILPPANGDASSTIDVPKDAGTLSRDACVSLCDASDVISCTYEEPGGVPTMHCVRPSYCGAGRRTAGVRGPRRRARSSDEIVGAWLAGAAHLEATAVIAFERLERELEAHRAPERLRARARTSAREEVRHARMVGAMARRRGAQIERPRVSGRQPVRTLAGVARENAVEGCVREAYGALLATWQARSARDARERDVFAQIARDETKHAALAWSVAAWADRRLSMGERRRVRRAFDRAWQVLDTELAAPPPRALVREGFLPPAKLARAWLAALARAFERGV